LSGTCSLECGVRFLRKTIGRSPSKEDKETRVPIITMIIIKRMRTSFYHQMIAMV